MKKNLFIVCAVIAVAALFTACPGPNSPNGSVYPKVEKVIFLDKDLNDTGLTDSDINFDADKIAYIDFVFDTDMDMTYRVGWVYWDDIGQDIKVYDWVNPRRFRFGINFRYNQYYQISLNNKEYCVNNPDFVYDYFRDKKGNYLEEKTIMFTTKEAPEAAGKTFEISLDDFSSLSFVKNEYDDPGKSTNVGYVNISYDLGKYKLRKGDKLIINYSIWSYSKLTNIRGHLADRSARVNYWNLLASEEDGKEYVFIPSLEPTPRPEGNEEVVPNYYTGTISFDIIADQIDPPVAIQLYYDRVEGEDPVTISFKQTTAN